MAFTELETQVGALATSVSALAAEVRGKLTLIDARLDQAVRDAPTLVRSVWVDPRIGADTNPGTQTSPMRTLKAACDTIPVGGWGQILLPAAPVVLDIDEADITLRNKSVLITVSPTPASANSYPVIRNSTFLRTDGSNQNRGFVLDNSTLQIRYCRIETAALLAPDASLVWAGFIRRTDTLGVTVGFQSCVVRLGGSPLIVRSTGASTLWAHFYGTSVDRVGEHQAPLISADQSPIVVGFWNSSVPAGQSLRDYIQGVAADADGRVINVLSNIELRI